MDLINPFKRLRLEAELTLTQLTELGAGSRAFISNAELGLYPDPPERIFAALNSEYGYLDYFELKEEYHAWQSAVRKSNYGCLKPHWLRDPRAYSTADHNVHPFTSWRLASGITSRVRPAKLYCVSPSIISRFELQPWRISSVPPVLTDALLDAGYDKELLATLTDRWVYYKGHLSAAIRH